MPTKGINKMILLGRLGTDPEVRYTQKGDPIVTLNMVTSETWRCKESGEQQEEAEWHKVVLFGKLAEVAAEYLKKGSQAFIEGKKKTRKYTDNNGVQRYATEIVVQGYNGTLQLIGGGSQQAPAQQQQPQAYNEEDIPF